MSPPAAQLPTPANEYDVSPFFILRTTGFPVETLHALRSSDLASAIDAYLRAPEGDGEQLRQNLEALYDSEMARVRKQLWAWASSEKFRHVLLFSSASLEQVTPKTPVEPPKRNLSARKKENAWIAYAQRLATKTDTISFFGPSTWGDVRPDEPLPLNVQLTMPAIGRRRAYLERWACDALAKAMTADADVRPELRVKVAEDAVLEGARARLLKTGAEVELSKEQATTLEACNLSPRVRDVNDAASLEALLAKGLVRLEVEARLAGAPFELLEREVSAWSPGPARARWTERLGKLRGGISQLESSGEMEVQRAALASVSAAMIEAGSEPTRDSRALYASRLPVNEDCERARSVATLGAPLIEQLSVDLAPWYELWRDLAGLYASRLFDVLYPAWKELSARGPVRLTELLMAADKLGVPLSRSGGVGALAQLEPQIQAAWQAQLGERMNQPEVELQPADLTFLRRAFNFRRMAYFDWPAPDITVAARDKAAVERGDWKLVVSELHPGFSPWLELFMGWCPAPDEQARFVAGGGGPALEYARSGSFDGPVHVISRAPDFLGGWTFSNGLQMEGQPYLRTAEVTVDAVEGQLLLKAPDGRVVGSLLDHWLVAMNTHRLELVGTGAHSPRLLLGRTIVQRRSWLVQPDDAERPEFEKLGLRKLLAVYRLKRKYALPCEVFVRPIMAVSRTHHKDSKPIFCDFRNPLTVEMLSGLFANYRTARVTEMKPMTDECWLSDAEGRYTFEVRLFVRPRG